MTVSTVSREADCVHSGNFFGLSVSFSRHLILLCDFAEELSAHLRDALLRLEVDINESEAIAEAGAPLEVIHHAPEKVSLHGRSVCGGVQSEKLRVEALPKERAQGIELRNSWVLRVVVRGKRRNVGLGSTRLVSLKEAREEAARLRGIARKGGDPLEVRAKERRVIPTFEAAAREVSAARKDSFRNEKHKKDWIDSLDKHIFPKLGASRVDHITSGDVLAVLSPIWLEIPQTARRLKQRIEVVMDWARVSGKPPFREAANPLDGLDAVLPKQNIKVKHFPALHYSRLPAFMQTCGTFRLLLWGLILKDDLSSLVHIPKGSRTNRNMCQALYENRSVQPQNVTSDFVDIVTVHFCKTV